KSLGGASIDQSFQLEPAQIAGFIQSYRSIIPDAIEGANAGARFETYGISLEQKFKGGTYLGASGEILNSKVRRSFGVFAFNNEAEDPIDQIAFVSSQRQHLDYRERSIRLTLDQLISDDWVLGASYRLTDALLERDFVDIPDTAFFNDGF